LRRLQILGPYSDVRGIGSWQYRSGLLMPLLVDGGAVGTLVLLHTSSGLSYGSGALAFSTELANRISNAIAANRRYAAEAEIAYTLQRNLLPRRLPEVPGVDVHAAYLAGGRTVAGGDFYDLFPVGDGRWMVVVGDVCGKGPEAASVMGIARASLRAIALREHSPARLMTLVNDALLDQVADERFVSACAAVLEPLADGSVAVTMCRAGHPPAVVRQGNGAVGLVGVSGGPLLGILANVELSEDKFVLNRDDRLVLYTDGVERPGSPADEVALGLVQQHGADRPDELADRFAEAMRAGSEGNADDLAVMVLTVSSAPKASFSGLMRDMIHRIGVL
jgi:serine phosphatase RsbU (regulator of sigma subunit)